MRPVDLEIEKEETWTVYDPESAQVIATFYSEEYAHHFVATINAGRSLRRLHAKLG